MGWCDMCANFCKKDWAICCNCISVRDEKPSHFKEKNDDNVNHPSHYAGKFECIDVMIETQGVEAVKDFCLCNAFKYLYRHNGKNGVEDIKKAKWYIEKYLELECDQDVKGNTIAEGA